jgi:hypothetical protein
MTKKHFIDLANMIAKLHNDKNKYKNNDMLLRFLQSEIIAICQKHNNNFNVLAFCEFVANKRGL